LQYFVVLGTVYEFTTFSDSWREEGDEYGAALMIGSFMKLKD